MALVNGYPERERERKRDMFMMSAICFIVNIGACN